MTRVLHWLGGWASSLDCWEPELRNAFPTWEHRFHDAHTYLNRSPGDAGLVGLPVGHVAAAWSMGTLLAHHWMASAPDGWPETLPLLSLCPIFRFVRPGGFGEPVLLRMGQKLVSDRETVLRDFWRRLPGAEGFPPAWETNWMAGTRRHSDAELSAGLEFLRLVAADISALRSPPSRWELLAGEKDTLAPPGDWMHSLPKRAKATLYPGGHLPFLECPVLIAAALERLASAHDH